MEMLCRNELKQMACLWERKEDVNITIMIGLFNYKCEQNIMQNKRQQECLWKQRTHYRLENGSFGFIETLHKQ